MKQGLAVSMAARLALPDPPKGVVHRPLLRAQPRTVALACLDVARLSPLAHAFWDMARSRSKLVGSLLRAGLPLLLR